MYNTLLGIKSTLFLLDVSKKIGVCSRFTTFFQTLRRHPLEKIEITATTKQNTQKIKAYRLRTHFLGHLATLKNLHCDLYPFMNKMEGGVNLFNI